MALSVGARLGPYEVIAPIGAGGMGEVYRACDTRLDRTVAIKVLPSCLADDPELKERFAREATAASSLNHPHICALFDIGRHDGIGFLVMEYLEGETLAQRLQKGPLPVDQALRYGIEIADALAGAHRKGLIHRDLKPSNIMLTKSGAKLLDFGLAKRTAPLGVVAAQATANETLEASLTAPGLLVGTCQYMAPEQLEGKEADTRSDIFAFGALLYEMVTGRPAFEGKSRASVIAKIMEQDPPPVSSMQPKIPPALECLVQLCLDKNPDTRWQSAHDLKLEISRMTQAGAAEAVGSTLRRRGRAAWAIALLLLVTASLLAVGLYRGEPQPVQLIRSSLLPPQGWYFDRNSFAISPDGTRLAFVAIAPDGRSALWVRALAGSGAQQIMGTEGALFPFWSPDSRRIGFFAAEKLQIVDVATATVRIVCDALVGRCGGTWNRDGSIVFAPSITGPLYRVPDTGGVPVPVTTLPRPGSAQSHRWPFFLPDGKHFLYAADWSTSDDPRGNGIYVGSLDASASELVSAEVGGNVAFTAGHLLYGRNHSLRAQPFDMSRLQLSGNEVSIAEQELEYGAGFSYLDFSVSENGVLVFQALAESTSGLMWYDAGGKQLSQIAEFGYMDPRISPDGRSLAVSSDDSRNGKRFVRVYDLARGMSNRLSNEGEEESPVWSPDGQKIAYVTFDGKLYYLKVKGVEADSSAAAEVLLKGPRMGHLDWSRDGNIVFSDFSKGPPSLKVYSVATRQIIPFGPPWAAEGRFSPNGKWIAYVSYGGVYVQRFPGLGGPRRISGGAQPVWSRDGRQIYSVAPDSKLLATAFDGRENSPDVPHVLFQTRIIGPTYIGTQYEVAPDGRLLINSVPANHSSPLTLVTGWTAQLKR